jgi:lipid A 3-O-deacylase
MRGLVSLILLLMVTATFSYAQENYTHLFRLYEDNDFINVLGKGTDKGYTNGTRIDYFFTKSHPSVFFIDRWLPKAGPSALNTFGYSVTQLMLAPGDLTKSMPDKHDWPYSGALFLTHSLYSADAEKKFSVHTEIVTGVSGALSFTENAQVWIHKVTHYIRPQGWDKQMPDGILLNLNLLAEKMIWHSGKSVELTAGGQVYAGTMQDGLLLQAQLRIGNMQPYFGGYTPAFSSAPHNGYRRFEFYFFLKPAAQYVAYNALLEGGVFSGRSAYYSGKDGTGSSPDIRNGILIMQAGLVLIAGRISGSVTEKAFSSVMKGVPGETVGNISLTYSW